MMRTRSSLSMLVLLMALPAACEREPRGSPDTAAPGRPVQPAPPEPAPAQPPGPEAPRPGSTAGPAADVSTDSVVGFLRAIPTGRAVRGSIDEQKGLVRTEQYITAQLREMGYRPRLQRLEWNLQYQFDAEARNEPIAPIYGGPRRPETTPELASNTWHNIIVEIPGTSRPAEVIIIGAHFDAVAGSPGADDNASGTAALLEMARVLRGHPAERTIRLIFFNLEEIGLRGAQEYARSLMPAINDEREELIGMISLEMLGYFSDEPGSQKSPIPPIEGVFDPPTVGDFIGIATIQAFSDFARAIERGMNETVPELKVVVADFAPVPPPDFLRSDHGPFMLLGWPALMLTDTSNFRNPHYHRPTDTIDTLDIPRYIQVVRAITGAVYALAGPATAER
jgi:hypothetical protein